MNSDITDRKKAEQALRESQSRLNITFEKAGVGIVEVEKDDHFIAANDRACEILGYSREELLRLNVAQLTYPEDRSLSAIMDKHVHQGKAERVSYEKRYLRKDGSPIWAFATVSGVRDEKGHWVKSITTIEDISERKRAEEALRKAVEDLKEADRRKDEFLAMLAHELRNPLATISAAATLLNRSESRVQSQTAKEAMGRQVKQLSKLIDDLLDVSRIIRGKISLDKETVDVKDVIGRALEVTMTLIRDAGQKIAIDLPAQPLFTNGDPLRLQEIFTNLITNAARYSDEGGEITVSGREAGHYAIVKVTDTGKGIEQHLQEKIFEPFVQLNPGIDRAKGGLGIGLTIVKRLTELHGGTVSVHSDGPGKGSTFTVSLPLRRPERKVTLETPAHVQPGLEILVIDDNKDAAVLTAALLEQGGHRTHVAYDGETGLKLTLEKIPDIILLDIGLPGMNGYEVAKRIRAEGLDSVLILAVTGYGQDHDRELSAEAGFDAHLLKPLQCEALFPIIADWQKSDALQKTRALRSEKRSEHRQ